MIPAPPIISIIMGVYDARPYLRKALDSIANQTFGDYEFIIVDDGSTDGSASILDQYAACDPRIRIVRSENRGLTRSLNEAARAARGEFLARMDPDDIAFPTRLEKQIRSMQENPDCVALGCAAENIDEDGDVLGPYPFCATHEEIEARHLSGVGGGVVHPTAMIRRTAFEQVGGYDESYAYAQDLDLWLRLAEIGRLANLPELLLQYRNHASGIGFQKAREQREAGERAAREAWKRRGRAGEPPLREVWPERETPAACHRAWAQSAFNHGHAETARKHAWRALRLEPCNDASWRVLGMVAPKWKPFVRRTRRLRRLTRRLTGLESAAL